MSGSDNLTFTTYAAPADHLAAGGAVYAAAYLAHAAPAHVAHAAVPALAACLTY